MNETITLTSLADADEYLKDDRRALQFTKVVCTFPVDAVVFFWLVRNSLGVVVDTSPSAKQEAIWSNAADPNEADVHIH